MNRIPPSPVRRRDSALVGDDHADDFTDEPTDPSSPLLYALDLRADYAQGRSRGPAGRGRLAAFVDVVVPFHYRVRLDVDDAGVGLRFPLEREQPGGGDYAQFFVAVVARGPVLASQRRFVWKVRTPRELALTSRGPHHENRMFFSYGVEDRTCMLGARFDGADGFVWRNDHTDHRRVPFTRPMRASSVLTFEALVDFDTERIVMRIDDEFGRLAVDVYSGTPLREGSCMCMLSGANTVAESNDPRLFFRLLDARIENGNARTLEDDAPVVAPALPARAG